MSLNCMLSGFPERSFSFAKLATETCESLSDPEYELYAPSYGLQGLSLLLMGKYTSAEELLQISARWSETPTAQVT